MAQPLDLSMSNDPQETVEQALAYLRAGLSVVPIYPGQKNPIGIWTPYMSRLATEQEVRTWYQAQPNAGIGIVGGPVSDNLVILDADASEFWKWLELRALDRLPSWWVRTGSGKLHLYLRSSTVVLSTVLNMPGPNGTTIKIADVIGPRELVVAPPSIHPDGGRYETIRGSFQNIVKAGDAMSIIQMLYDNFLLEQSGAVTPPPTPVSAPGIAPTVGPANRTIRQVTPERTKELLEKLAQEQLFSGRLKRAVTKGAEPGEGEWPSAPSRSHIDHAVCLALLEHGWTDDEIEDLYAGTPIGEVYRDITRPNHGHAYLQQDLAKWRKNYESAQQAAKVAAGLNFQIEKVVRLDYEEPVYEITFKDTEKGSTGTVQMTAEDITSETRFERSMIKAINLRPQLLPQHTGRQNFKVLTDAIVGMATREAVPEGAGATGYLKSVIIKILSQNGTVQSIVPAYEGAFQVAWKHPPTNHLFVRSGALIDRISTQLKPSPPPEKVWGILRSFGGLEIKYQYQSGAQEHLWVLPLNQIQK